ncbi:uncharacterized protein LOC132735247 [Ruditapes philippinarum]|uniref:uncharacterized protein LOC132735247 n=1 Tax=Ruditapes philippinarum TaxID=129788 RepID=UPI00295AA3B8|nr:uncharacterized protein LOC132735247 [Ruditapes philippinarum]
MPGDIASSLVVLLIGYLKVVASENLGTCNPFQLKREHLNIRLKEHMIHETTTDHHNCARFCFYLTACKSFDYDRQTNACKLNDADSTDVQTTEFETSVHSIYSDITGWPQGIAGPCGSRPCGLKQRCLPAYPPRCLEINTSTVQCHIQGVWEEKACTPKDCGQPTTENGFATLLDSSNTTYMALATVTCNEGYETNTLHVKCQSDATWSAGNCAKISCGSLPSIANGVATLSLPGSNLYLDTATLECNYGYTATPATFKCLSSKSWEYSHCACMPISSYQGTLSSTVDGFYCQRWDSQSPHGHTYTNAATYPDTSVSAANNYCRALGETYLWCYTTNIGKRWDYCNKPTYIC